MGSVVANVAAAAAGLALATAAFVRATRTAFHRRFLREAAAAVAAAGRHPGTPVMEEDLRGVPEPVARWIRWSGALGRPRVSVLRMSHGGRFKASPRRPWMVIHGEYVITTHRPSFTWYGRMAIAPGLHAAAIDEYRDGRGRMLVRALSAITMVDARSGATDASAFGRCVAELSMTPTFFLDRERVRWTEAGPGHARGEVADGALSTPIDLYVREDGALDRVEVLRWFDRGGGRATLERFVGRASGEGTWGGRRLPARFDGVWRLPEGELHYVAFDVEQATFE
jgi:hypothetical protein